jgi:DNA polymerase II small subunit/DNA polymerase delta subunit B
MFSKKVIINLQKKDDTIHIEPLGDVHVGHVGFIEDAYEQSYATLKFTKNRATTTIRVYARGAGQCSCRMTDTPPPVQLLTSPSQ